ncbi:hypothetical protein [Halapricum hydrolyticum]|uniref:DUF7984 domain-containing protein n=1 Tax=Halapricum hydrolyticum TaxID=2979991 RepID=A0AAE3ICS9_9EURY|nr:hypothetical protein [Halapricum hydrolyticum]MCU4719027.1 hypothetical protein [Halapricum hydrolyticum]MCU4728016.1 hypothetical protein [Halapricum hydrolyticum]
MKLTSDTIRAEYDWVHERGPTVVPIVNTVRADLGDAFETTVDPIDVGQYHDAVDAVFSDGDRAVNVAALVGLLRDLDVPGDYPGFVVDELLARELAAMIAGEQPLRLLAEATFHYADVYIHGDPDDPAGLDDLDAALAAGVQTRLPGWDWQAGDSPFGVDP